MFGGTNAKKKRFTKGKSKDSARSISATRIAAISAIIGAIAGALATFGAAGLGFFNKHRELNIKMIEISIGILEKSPEAANTPEVRKWAIRTLNRYAEEKLPLEAQKELLLRRLQAAEARHMLERMNDDLDN